MESNLTQKLPVQQDTPTLVSAFSTNLHEYLEKALDVFQQYKLSLAKDNKQSELVELLKGVSDIDPVRVLAIANVVQYTHGFNEFVRDNVQDARIGTRYAEITSMFDSIRDDAKMLIKHLDDGKIDWKEKGENLWMKLTRGTTHARFEKIRKIYNEVCKDTKHQLELEENVIGAYINFRFALKSAEGISYELLKIQTDNLNIAKQKAGNAQAAFENAGEDLAEKSMLQLERDKSGLEYKQEDKKYQLIKDVAEGLSVGYNVGETLVMKLTQTHEAKEQVYKKSVTFFTTNEHIFTTMDAVYTAQQGLHESTQTLESMKEGVNKGLEDIAELGGKIEEAAIKAGYGSTINPDSMKKFVDSLIEYQVRTVEMVKQSREQSTEDAKEVAAIVEDGKKRYAAAVYNFNS